MGGQKVPSVYVLSWYPDGGGGAPEVKFFGKDQAVSAATYAAEEARSGKSVVIRNIPPIEATP